MKKYFLKLIIAISPIFSFAQSDFYTLGKIEMGEGNYAQAEQYFNRALGNDPTNPTILNALATSLLKQKKYKSSDSVLQIAAKNDSSFVATYWNLGIVNINLKQDSIAIIWFEKHIHFGHKRDLNPSQSQIEIIRCFDRIMRREGLSETQLMELYRFMDVYKNNNNENYGEIKMIEKMMYDYSPANPKFKKIEDRYQWIQD